jgi:hypothetical protein
MCHYYRTYAPEYNLLPPGNPRAPPYIFPTDDEMSLAALPPNLGAGISGTPDIHVIIIQSLNYTRKTAHLYMLPSLYIFIHENHAVCIVKIA